MPDDTAGYLDLAMRYVAQNDFASHARRPADALVNLLRRKTTPITTDSVARCLSAYDAEWRALEAYATGTCRRCKISRSIHYHTELYLRDGELCERLSARRCTEVDCRDRAAAVAHTCFACAPPTTKRNARNLRTNREIRRTGPSSDREAPCTS